ncbi:MAG: bifunctional 5,10-methylenetetrahydrofolate dehydrogenase/5,10-methenyltetrahydrofolate cyclohydrolase [Armatimonadetes bacterium]|nr:bifunctional 5,10-methylenetetrahydrofolate dehydrogenase/5,10-methenyltetrahydrofolate cyclohydrolase [Armatimonadota bacterium]NIM23575.1 bifunctional 5,10-methylenetetrahydrofolate dehydrogenase/5,10-methenyltetrahydrofolate cyclohydrolase [Armatimonadota bacterium]NIM67441.1 bifunctional 5,10-methylenetetrahydrofolate dehydrogenase/5,10-methenyltetrahydrofolate cyclohydrolase [Armatimonadota bacterium]NIM75942.1 bifunctional 5,10-methylenetetrahydrofolate dehydrogenase/5,10-methenyltetrah
MAAKLLEGAPIAEQIKEKLRAELSELKSQGVVPSLAAVMVGSNPGAVFYAKMQEKACSEIGIEYELKTLEESTGQAELEEVIAGLNADEKVNGIILQMPVPKQIDGRVMQAKIDPRKDVDGVNPANLGSIVLGNPRLAPCTAMSVMMMVKASGIDVYGKEAVVIGSSEIVGKPAALLLMDKWATMDETGNTDKLAGATVTVCHIGTSEKGDLSSHTRRADLLVTAVGVKPGLISADMLKPGAVVIDVATIRKKDPETGKSRTLGDVEPEGAKEIASAITPVPGGVGTVTTALLLKNTVEATKWQLGK